MQTLYWIITQYTHKCGIHALDKIHNMKIICKHHTEFSHNIDREMRNTRSRQNTQCENNLQTLYRIITQYTHRNEEYALSFLQVNWADGWNTGSPFSKLTKTDSNAGHSSNSTPSHTSAFFYKFLGKDIKCSNTSWFTNSPLQWQDENHRCNQMLGH